MNTARLTILVNIVRQNANALKDVDRELKQINQSSRLAAGGGSKLFGAFGYLEKLGKDLQWTGRQLEFRFTLPLVAAGYAATQFAMNNERAFTQLRKVYQAGGDDIHKVTNELGLLRRGFELLSNIYGVQQDQVITIGKLWAEAGLSGTNLAKAVRSTLDVMILGDMQYEEAAKALVILRAQYQLTSDQLTKSLAIINVVENETAVSFQDLIDGITRAGGTARTVGVDIRHLAALISALSPAAGSAAAAGNGLKTIFSRIFAPTKQAAEVMKLAGINIRDAAWQSQNGYQRLETLSKAFVKLTPAQQAYFSSFVAGRFQINRMDVLLRDIANPMGNYHKALRDTANDTKNLAQYQKEVNTLLSSSPQAFQQLKTVIENELAKAIIPLIPLLLQFIGFVAHLLDWFTHLNPSIQKTVISLLGLLAILGPIVAYTGAFILLFSTVGKAFINFGKGIASAIGWLIKFVTQLFTTKAAASTTAAEAEAEFASVTEAVLAEISTIMEAIGSLGFQAGEIFITAITAAINAGLAVLPEEIAAQLGAITTAMIQLWAAAGAYIGGAFESGILAAIEAATPVKVAAVEAQMAAVSIAAIGGVAALGAGVGTMMEGVVEEGILVPLAELGPGVEAAMADVIDVEGWEVLGSEVGGNVISGILGSISAGTAGLVAAVTLVFADIVTAIAYTSNNFFDFLIGLWVGFFGGLPGLLWAIFRDGWEKGLRGLAQLPLAVFHIMQEVIDVLYRAAKFIWDALSYLNPFATHSPSLVDLVNSGVDIILAKYQSLRSVDIGAAWRKAAADIQRYNSVAQGMKNRAADFDINRNIMQIGATDPSAVPAAKALAADIRVLRDDLNQVAAAYGKQLVVVNRWQASLDAANASLDAQQDRLRREQYVLDQLSQQLSDSKDALDKWASTPIQGMKAMDDAIFENEQSTKAYQLQLLKLEDTFGTLDGLDQKLQNINGEMELLSGQRNALRMKGGGSDVLGVFTDQMNKLSGKESGVSQAVAQMKKLQDEINRLQHRGQELDLEKSLKFDRLTREIDQLAHGMREMPFDVIKANVARYRGEVDRLTAAYDAQNKIVKISKLEVDKLQFVRDNIQRSYDIEKKKLDDLGKAYDGISQMIDLMTSAIDSAAQAAKEAKPKIDELAQGFADAAAGKFDNFSDALNNALDPQKLDDLIKKWEEEWKKKFGKFDPFAAFKDAWHKFQDWWTKHAFPFIKRIPGDIVDALSKLGWLLLGWLEWPFKQAWHRFQDWWNRTAEPWLVHLPENIVNWLSRLGWLLLDIFAAPFKAAWHRFQDWWDRTAWPFITGLPGRIGGALGSIFDVITEPFRRVWQELGGGKGSIPYQLGRIVGWFITLPFRIIGALIMLPPRLWGLFFRMFGYLKDHLPGWAAGVYNFFKDLPKKLWGYISGFGKQVWHFFEDIFKVLWRSLPGWAFGVYKFFMELPFKLMSFIAGFGQMLLSWMWGAVQNLWHALPGIWSVVYNFFRDLPKNFWHYITTFSDWLASHIWSWMAGLARGAVDFFKGVWDSIKGTFAGPINWVIRNVINKFSQGVNSILNLLHVPDQFRVPELHEVSSRHTGGIVGENDSRNGTRSISQQRADEQLIMALKGEGVLPRNVMANLPPGAFEALRRGDKDVIAALNGEATTKAALDLLKGPNQTVAQVGFGFSDLSPGNLIHAGIDAVGKLAGWVIDKVRKLIAESVRPLIEAALKAGDDYLGPLGVPGRMLMGITHKVADDLLDWIAGVDKDADAASKSIATANQPGLGANGGINPSQVPPNMYQEVVAMRGRSGSYQTLIRYLASTGTPFIVTSTTGGTGHVKNSYHYRGEAVDFAYLTPGRGTPELNNIFWAFGPIMGLLLELIHSPEPFNIKNGNRVAPYAVADHYDHVHAALEAGAFVRRSPAGVVARLGEGRYNELVSPLPPGFNMGRVVATMNRVEKALAGEGALGGEVTVNKEYHFHGDLSFPNIKTPDHAQNFIRNLESLVD